MTFTTERQVRFAHVDAAGIAYYPRLLEMVDGAVEDWSRATFGVGRGESHLSHRLGTPAVTLTVRFVAAARLDDVLRFEVQVRAVGRTSLDLVVTASCEGEPRFEAEIRQVAIDLDAVRATEWPGAWRQAMQAQLEG